MLPCLQRSLEAAEDQLEPEVELVPVVVPGRENMLGGERKSEAWKVATWYLVFVLVLLVLALVLAWLQWIVVSIPFVGDALDRSFLGDARDGSDYRVLLLWILAGWLPWGLAVAGTRGGARR